MWKFARYSFFSRPSSEKADLKTNSFHRKRFSVNVDTYIYIYYDSFPSLLKVYPLQFDHAVSLADQLRSIDLDGPLSRLVSCREELATVKHIPIPQCYQNPNPAPTGPLYHAKQGVASSALRSRCGRQYYRVEAAASSYPEPIRPCLGYEESRYSGWQGPMAGTDPDPVMKRTGYFKHFVQTNYHFPCCRHPFEKAPFMNSTLTIMILMSSQLTSFE